MRKSRCTMKRTGFVVLVLGFIWCLSLLFFSEYYVQQDSNLVASGNVERRSNRVWMNANRTEDVMKIFLKFVDDLLNMAESPANSSLPVTLTPSLKDNKEELRALRQEIEAEKGKRQINYEMIKELQSDKVYLKQQVAYFEELLKKHMENGEMKTQQVKSENKLTGDKNCPLPNLDGYPDCEGKIKWMKEMWKSDPCYGHNGVNGSLCSMIIYLSEVETWCPLLKGRVIPTVEFKKPQVGSEPAVVRDSLNDLYISMKSKTQYKWIDQRIHSMENIWVEAGRTLSAKHNLTNRIARQILVHPGAVTDESGFKIAASAFNGGPLGELVQWSDLIATLHILGHHVHLSASIPDLKNILGFKSGGCPSTHTNMAISLIYTDIIGFKQIQKAFPRSWMNYKCVIRVLDSFGTEPDFNHKQWSKEHKLIGPFGGLHLTPMQFYTMFPHTPDNTFLGFVVQSMQSPEETEKLKSIKRQNQALVYGKRTEFWKNKSDYLDVIHKYMDIHGTVDTRDHVPSYVNNHGIVKGTEVHALLRQSKVFVGLSFPYEGPAPLEALANGCAFLNPRLEPPLSSLNSDFFKGKPNTREVTSQHPYAEAIGEPYVWMVDMQNKSDVERAVKAILNQTIEPYLPYEFSCEGMLQRVNVLIEKQDLCSSERLWPPLSTLQVIKAEAGTSCKKACQKAGLICEPTFFPILNNAKNLAKYNIECRTSEYSESELVFPAFNTRSKHCVFQSDPLLFSCVRSTQSLTRICPCRDYIKDQIALCKACI